MGNNGSRYLNNSFFVKSIYLLQALLIISNHSYQKTFNLFRTAPTMISHILHAYINCIVDIDKKKGQANKAKIFCQIYLLQFLLIIANCFYQKHLSFCALHHNDILYLISTLYSGHRQWRVKLIKQQFSVKSIYLLQVQLILSNCSYQKTFIFYLHPQWYRHAPLTHSTTISGSSQSDWSFCSAAYYGSNKPCSSSIQRNVSGLGHP